MEALMNVDSALLKKKREEKSWSQEHLATVSGLSLRTVQRVEAKGSASAETRMSIASALGVEPSELLPKQSEQADQHATPRACSRTTGTLLILGGVLLFLCCFILVLRANSPDVAMYLRVTTGLAIGAFQSCAAVVGLLGILFSLSGILILMKSRHAFAFCVATILCTLSLYGLSVIFIPLRPAPSDVLLVAPILLVAGFAARCSFRNPLGKVS